MKNTCTKLSKIAITTLLLGQLTAFAENPVIAIAVDPRDGRSHSELSQDFRDMLEELVVNSGAFDVVERQKLDNIMEELGYQNSGMVDPASALRFGTQSGARYLLFGSVIRAADDTTTFHGYGTSTRSRTRLVGVKAKVIDLSNGRLVGTYTEEATDTILDNQNLRRDNDNQNYQLTRQAAGNVLSRILAAPFLKDNQVIDKKMVTIKVEGEPKDANVEIDGILYGNVGSSFQIEQGLHEIKVSRSGYEAVTKKANCADGTSLNIALDRIEKPDLAVTVENK